jgi:hypothetical protein
MVQLPIATDYGLMWLTSAYSPVIECKCVKGDLSKTTATFKDLLRSSCSEFNRPISLGFEISRVRTGQTMVLWIEFLWLIARGSVPANHANQITTSDLIKVCGTAALV